MGARASIPPGERKEAALRAADARAKDAEDPSPRDFARGFAQAVALDVDITADGEERHRAQTVAFLDDRQSADALQLLTRAAAEATEGALRAAGCTAVEVPPEAVRLHVVDDVDQLIDDLRMLATGEPVLSAPVCRALSRHLDRSAPWHVRVRVEPWPGGVDVGARSLRWRVGHRSMHGGGERVEERVRAALDSVQHFIAWQGGPAWPRDEPLPRPSPPTPQTFADDTARRRHIDDVLAWEAALPKPAARIDSGRIVAWYGDEHAPALRLPAITVE